VVRPFKPNLILKADFNVVWRRVVRESSATGPAGLRFQRNDKGTQSIEYRDAGGELRGMLKLSGTGEALSDKGDLVLMVDPEHRRQGIATALLAEAARLGLDIRFERQRYTRPGWATIKKFLGSSAEAPVPDGRNSNG
jgi:GNAT superfamily N-acetyltransferase